MDEPVGKWSGLWLSGRVSLFGGANAFLMRGVGYVSSLSFQPSVKGIIGKLAVRDGFPAPALKHHANALPAVHTQALESTVGKLIDVNVHAALAHIGSSSDASWVSSAPRRMAASFSRQIVSTKDRRYPACS